MSAEQEALCRNSDYFVSLPKPKSAKCANEVRGEDLREAARAFIAKLW